MIACRHNQTWKALSTVSRSSDVCDDTPPLHLPPKKNYHVHQSPGYDLQIPTSSLASEFIHEMVSLVKEEKRTYY
jgi:hypothetical protein